MCKVKVLARRLDKSIKPTLVDYCFQTLHFCRLLYRSLKREESLPLPFLIPLLHIHLASFIITVILIINNSKLGSCYRITAYI